MTGVHPSKVDLRELDDERDRLMGKGTLMEHTVQFGLALDDERDRLMDLCRKDIGKAARKMVKGKDKKRLAHLMGVSVHTFGQKLILGRFTASQFLMLSYLCGYEIKLKDKYQTMIDDFLED